MANTICIYYDLTNPEENYPAIKEYLGRYNGYERSGEKLWFITTERSTTEIRDELINTLTVAGSKILVFTVGEYLSFSGLTEVESEWLRDNWHP